LEWDALLRSGYLLEVLPPGFTTETYADFVQARGKREFVGQTGPEWRTRPAAYNATKRGNQRRTFGFPHPESFHDISLFISNNWQRIIQRIDASTYTRSKPMPDITAARAISITPHQKLAIMLYDDMSPYRYVVKTDVSRFYPSVYTHSVPWSMHGREAAKADNRTNSTTVTFNKLDALMRQSQDGQSVGLPVGPDTSRIIAEIVGAAVDENFQQRYSGKAVCLVRHVDDVWIGASSMTEAEEYLYAYRECLREYELDINELKTSIDESAVAFETAWPLSLKRLIRNEFRSLNREDKTRILSEVFRLAHEQRDDGIVKYAIRRFDRERLWQWHWRVLESF
jgi:hypothetical protein